MTIINKRVRWEAKIMLPFFVCTLYFIVFIFICFEFYFILFWVSTLFLSWEYNVIYNTFLVLFYFILDVHIVLAIVWIEMQCDISIFFILGVQFWP